VNDATYDLTCEHDLDGNILAVNGAAARARGEAKDRRAIDAAGDLRNVKGDVLFIRGEGLVETPGAEGDDWSGPASVTEQR